MVAYVCCVPRIVRWLEAMQRMSDMSWWRILQFIGVFWGVLVGPMIGCSIGALVAPFINEGWTACQGAFLGLVYGSLMSTLGMAIVLPIVYAVAIWHLHRVTGELPPFDSPNA